MICVTDVRQYLRYKVSDCRSQLVEPPIDSALSTDGRETVVTKSGGAIEMRTETCDASAAAGAPDDASADSNRAETAREASPPGEVARSSEQSRTDSGDRRKPSLKSFVYGAVNPRRRRIRRDEDSDRTYLDWHPTHLIVVCTTILVLSLSDGLLTVYLVQSGVKEFNPLMPFLGSNGPVLLSLTKFVLTAAVVVALVLTAHMKIYRFIRASTVLYLFLSCYLVLVMFQAALVRAMV